MRFLILAAFALGVAGALVVGAASATAQEAGDALGDLPIPDPAGWIPSPLDWLPGGLNPVNWAKDIVKAVFPLLGWATVALCLAVMGVRPRLLRLRVTPEMHDAPARAG